MISHNIQSFHRKIITSQSPNLITTIFRGLFFLLSIPFYLVSKLRSFLYGKKIFKVTKLDKPVISVGNIAVGGTGKTPFCIELIKLCLKQNHKPALVSRGYGNDEKKIYQKRFPEIPMAFSPNRILACQELIAQNPQISCIILDDAFQHQKIGRDLNILLINSLEPFGFNYCLPRGFLRESLNAIRRANLIILTHADEINYQEKEQIKAKIKTYTDEDIPLFEASHEPEYLLSPSGDKINFEQFKKNPTFKIAMFCGVAQPKGFLNTLNKLQISPTKSYIFADHYQYLSNDFEKIAKEKISFDCLITTEKDIVKIPDKIRLELNVYTLVMRLKVLDEEKLLARITELIK